MNGKTDVDHKKTIMLLCLLLLLGTCTQASWLAPPTNAVDCVADPTDPSCVNFHLNDTFIQKMLVSLCDPGPMSMEYMGACTVRTECVNDTNTAGSPYCNPFAILISACIPMPGMPQCHVTNALCKNGSVVADCNLPRCPVPDDDQLNDLVRKTCKMMPMVGCDLCIAPDGKPKDCHALQVYSDLCLSMPGMDTCVTWSQFCKFIPDWDLCSYGNSKMPRMEMFFHTGIYDYILFKEWVPQSMTAYILAVFAVFALSAACEGFKLVRHKAELSWKKKYEELLRKRPIEEYSLTPDHAGHAGSSTRRPYDFSIELQRAILRTLEVFFHYILMLIAMTFNVGLFVAVIAGVGFGSLLWGPLYSMETEAGLVTNEDCH